MQIVIISTFTLLALICCESSLLASAAKPLDKASLNAQLIEHVKKEDAVQVQKLLEQGADANAQCEKGISAFMYATFDTIYWCNGNIPLSDFDPQRHTGFGLSPFLFKGNPRTVALLLHYGADCMRVHPYLRAMDVNDKKQVSPLAFIAQRMSAAMFGNNNHENSLKMLSAIVGNLHRSRAHNDAQDTLDTMLYEIVVEARGVDREQYKKNYDLLEQVVKDVFFAGASLSLLSRNILNRDQQRADDLVRRLEVLQNQQLKSVKDALAKAGFPQELIALTLECMVPNPEQGTMPHDLRVLRNSDSLKDQDIHRIEHYCELGGDVDANVTLAAGKKVKDSSSVQQKKGAKKIFDLLDLAFKHDSSRLYGVLKQYEHKRIFSVIDGRYNGEKRRKPDLRAMYNMANEKKCKKIMDFIMVDRMHAAASDCNEQELKKLLEAGADMNARSNDLYAWDLLRTVVWRNVGKKMESCIKLVLRKGIDIPLYERDDSKDDPDGPYYKNVESRTDNVLGKLIGKHSGGIDNIVALLLYVGVRPQYTNKYGRTIYDVIGSGNQEIEAMLRDPDHIERYVTPQQLEEFAAIKKEREESLQKMKEKSACQTAAAPKA